MYFQGFFPSTCFFFFVGYHMAISFLDTKWKACVTAQKCTSSSCYHGYRPIWNMGFLEVEHTILIITCSLETWIFIQLETWKHCPNSFYLDSDIGIFPPIFSISANRKMKFCGSLKVIGSKEKCYKIGHMKHSCLLALGPKVAWITFYLFVCLFGLYLFSLELLLITFILFHSVAWTIGAVHLRLWFRF